MTDTKEMTLEEREATLGGIGCARKRKEDIRFIQGKGNYTDDLQLKGMVHGDFVRSSHAHAKIKSINKDAALEIPGVLAVLTADDLRPLNLHWMPTLAGDSQAVLADEKVHFQNQEIAFVIGTDRYAVADGIEAVEVDYEELPVLVDPSKAMDKDAPILRDDIADKDEAGQGPRKHPNHIFNWQAGDADATDKAFADADVTVSEHIVYPRVVPSPLETCCCVADMDPVTGKLTLHGTFQAPHVVRTIVSLISGIAEHNIRVISPDIGGGFGNKVGAYPGYVCSVVGSIVLKQPVKWVESRIDNLSTTAFARDYHMDGELAATKDGKITGLRAYALADHGAFNAHAQPSKWPAGLFSIVSGSYDIAAAHCSVDGVFTNKAPGGVAYRCSFRVTEAAYLIERMIDVLARKLDMDPAELRSKNLIQPEQFPYTSAFGWQFDSGDYPTAMKKALKAVDYKGLRKEQAKKRA
ncbi:MAG TPA: carbon monoxide dehydrogenase, partial [Rhodospirillales bacterium]|nr:carbon monoxide dehydrogenase [Rhodospirillales bacterium]